MNGKAWLLEGRAGATFRAAAGLAFDAGEPVDEDFCTDLLWRTGIFFGDNSSGGSGEYTAVGECSLATRLSDVKFLQCFRILAYANYLEFRFSCHHFTC